MKKSEKNACLWYTPMIGYTHMIKKNMKKRLEIAKKRLTKNLINVLYTILTTNERTTLCQK
jgi:DUF2075 family protein